uniref:Minor structural protein n=1 Tax=Rhesus macaque recovirus TaxID=875071 RepID=A0A067YMZ1_9CALI|nr:minor structural protein [Rhesus macaque recovirus]
MAGAAFASGLGQAAGGIFGALIGGAIQSGLNEQTFNHNKQLAEQQFNYNKELAAQNLELTKDLNSYNRQLNISKYVNAGFSSADAALLTGNTNASLQPTRVLTSSGIKIYAQNQPNSYLTSGMQLSSGIQTMYSALKSRSPNQSKMQSVYNWVNNPLNYDTQFNVNFPSTTSQSSRFGTLRSSNFSFSRGSIFSISSWGSYMDRVRPLN